MRLETYFSGKPFEDHIYAEGKLVRIDKDAKTQAPYLFDLDLPGNPIWAGFTEPYKLYENPTLSVYVHGLPQIPSNYHTDFTQGFYGIKIDQVTGERLYKVEDHSYPGGFYAFRTLTYNEQEELLGVDYYFYAKVAEAKAYAHIHDLVFPVPEELESKVWLWGSYYGLEESPKVMKAYVEIK